jgi:anti-anti-sigma factor
MSAADFRTESTRLGLSYSRASNGVVCLAATGEVDIGTVDVLRTGIDDALRESGVTQVVLDFGPLRFLDSSGIAVLIGAHRFAQEHGIVLAIVNCHGTVRHVLEVTGVYEVLAIAPDA